MYLYMSRCWHTWGTERPCVCIKLTLQSFGKQPCHSCGFSCSVNLARIMSDHAADDLRDDEGTDWNTSTASSIDPAQRGQINLFCSVTGADSDSAIHVLEAHNWDMDRSVMFFMEGGASSSVPQHSRPSNSAVAPAHTSTAQPTAGPIDLDDDVPSLEPERPAETTASAPPSQHEVRDSLQKCDAQQMQYHPLTITCWL